MTGHDALEGPEFLPTYFASTPYLPTESVGSSSALVATSPGCASLAGIARPSSHL